MEGGVGEAGSRGLQGAGHQGFGGQGGGCPQQVKHCKHISSPDYPTPPTLSSKYVKVSPQYVSNHISFSSRVTSGLIRSNTGPSVTRRCPRLILASFSPTPSLWAPTVSWGSSQLQTGEIFIVKMIVIYLAYPVKPQFYKQLYYLLIHYLSDF